MTYKLPALSNATSCVVCHVYLSGNCGQLWSASYLCSPSPRMTGDLVFFAVRMDGVAITAAAPAAAFKNSRRRIAAIFYNSVEILDRLSSYVVFVAVGLEPIYFFFSSVAGFAAFSAAALFAAAF